MGIGNRSNDAEQNSDTIKKHAHELVTPRYCLSDLVLPERTKSALLDFMALKNCYEKVFNEWGLNLTHRGHRQNAVNFYGESGTGKTMSAHVVANEMQQPLIIASYAELESKYVGETSKNITDLFNKAKEQNAIIFFDEADAILSRRVTNMSNATDVSVNQTRSVLLTLMDSHDGLVIFATNFIENYDPAFMRRILSHVRFFLPDYGSRTELWKMYIPKSMPTAVDFDKLAELSSGLSAAEISNSVIKAALSAARNNDLLVTETYFLNAINEILYSKNANSRVKLKGLKLDERQVSKAHVEEKIGINKMKEITE